jgi:hypothetical protein
VKEDPLRCRTRSLEAATEQWDRRHVPELIGAEWTSLEIAKLAVSVVTPLLLVGIGFVINRGVRRIENVEWGNRKLIERRISLYDAMAPKLNDLYCFFRCVGSFREIDPPTALKRKRELDSYFHVNRFLFSPDFATQYHGFMDACFETYTGGGEDAKLKSDVEEQAFERGAEHWDPSWTNYFVSDGRDLTNAGEIRSRYESLMASFSRDLGVLSTQGR